MWVLIHFSHVSLFVTLWTVDHQASLSMDSPGKNTRVGCHALIQGIFLMQGSNPCLLVSCIGRWDFYHWQHLRSPSVVVQLCIKISTLRIKLQSFVVWGFPGGSLVKNLPAKEGDAGSVAVSGRSPGEGNGSRFQYSCLGNPTDRGAWWATVHGVAKESDTTEQ